ncbi:MAG: transposase [Leptolyngbya sp. SIO4C1]|nr:transposase [Leptolyngbya sp. SIO4C1]
MLDINRILKNDRLMRALTGLNRAAFDALVPSFTQAYQAAQLGSKQRQRAPGAGRKANIDSIADKLFFILLYFKVYPTFDLAGILFDFDRSQANRWVHRLQPILEAALGRELVLSKRQIRSLEEFVESFPAVERVIIDGIERPIQRPKDSKRQKRTYSGKKKRHTRKQLGVSDSDKRILAMTPAEDGKFHDKCLLDASVLVEHIPEDVLIQVDLGFKGLEEEYENIEIAHKKPRSGELSDEQKAQNRAFSSERVVVEHAFGGTKRYGAASDIYRNRKTDFDDRLMLTSAGLWNFYLKAA